jgi:Uma2 family endonuclease
VIFEEQFAVPLNVGSLGRFREWAASTHFPQRGRIDFIAGDIEVDMSPEDLFCHGSPKVEVIRVLSQLVKESGDGLLFADRARVSCPAADLSVEPDLVFVSDASLDAGRARLVAKETGKPRRYVELEGAVDLIVEIVSDRSVAKDTRRLPAAYWRAGVREFWLIDSRAEPLRFQIHRCGPASYEPVAPDRDGFQHSAVFDIGFQLARNVDRRGRWTFDLRTRR